jgi:hypothetical protein
MRIISMILIESFSTSLAFIDVHSTMPRKFLVHGN